MRRCLGILLAACAAFTAIGCTTLSGVDPALMDGTIQAVSETSVNLGLQALAKDPAKADSVKADVTIAKQVVETTVLPLFKGADLNTITLATANQAMTILNGKVSPQISGILQTAIDGALLVLKLPDNPTNAGLTDDQRNLIVALFTGIDAGMNDFLSSSKALGPPLKGMAWKKGGLK